MTLSQTYSWIFYAIVLGSQNEAINWNAIEQVADGINHAVPTQKEISSSIKWLLKNQLIEKIGKKYRLKEAGNDILKTISVKPGGIAKNWDRIERIFAKMGLDNSHNINPRTLRPDM